MKIKELTESVLSFNDSEDWISTLRNKWQDSKVQFTTDSDDIRLAYINRHDVQQQVGWFDPAMSRGEVWTEIDFLKRNT